MLVSAPSVLSDIPFMTMRVSLRANPGRDMTATAKKIDDIRRDAPGRRQRRSVRSDARHVRRTERDLWILESVGKMRFTTTTQLARLHFEDSRWAANKRLRKLLDAGLIRAWVRSLSEENVYSLDRAGARFLEKDSAGDGWSAPRGLDRNLDHLLAINQVRVSIALSLPDGGGEILWWRSDWELRKGVRGEPVPDALFEVRWGDGTARVFALEVENTGRSPRRFLRKILAYAKARRGETLLGFSDLTLLVVCRNPRELDRYHDLVAAAGIEVLVGFARLEEIGRGSKTPWVRIRGEEYHSLQGLVSPAYCKETSGGGIAYLAKG